MKRWIIIISFVFVGCSPEAAIDATPDAKELANKFIEKFSPENVSELMSLYGDEFWTHIPKETWAKVLPNVYDELGAIEACELVNWSQSTQASTSGTGNFVFLDYACKHVKYESNL